MRDPKQAAHHDEAARDALLLDDEARIARVDRDLWIGCGRAREVHARLGRMLLSERRVRPDNLPIVGASNNGKTAIARRFLARHTVVEDAEAERSTIPSPSSRPPTVRASRRCSPRPAPPSGARRAYGGQRRGCGPRRVRPCWTWACACCWSTTCTTSGAPGLAPCWSSCARSPTCCRAGPFRTRTPPDCSPPSSATCPCGSLRAWPHPRWPAASSRVRLALATGQRVEIPASSTLREDWIGTWTGLADGSVSLVGAPAASPVTLAEHVALREPRLLLARAGPKRNGRARPALQHCARCLGGDDPPRFRSGWRFAYGWRAFGIAAGCATLAGTAARRPSRWP